jgi:anthranilate/para-aminobenzoate synthase component II
MILVLDNRDSFVHNLARYVRELGEDAVVRRSDEMDLGEVERLAPSHILISPGPCTPAEAGISTEVVGWFGLTTSILGVCPAISIWRGTALTSSAPRVPCTVRRRSSRTTGRRRLVRSPLRMARYHSLSSHPRRFRPASRAGVRRGRRRDYGHRAPHLPDHRCAVSPGVGGERMATP